MTKRIDCCLKMLLLAALFASPVQASLVGQTFDFTYSQTGFSASDLNRAYTDPGAELASGDGGNLDSAGVLLAGTSIDLFADSIVFNLRGGGAVHSPGFETTGAAADGKFRIEGFSDSLNNLFEMMAGDLFAIDLNNVVGVGLGSELVINNDDVTPANNYIDLFIGTLGIDEISDLGSITLRVERDSTPPPSPSAIPLPAALPLMLSALAVLGLLGRIRKTT